MTKIKPILYVIVSIAVVLMLIYIFYRVPLTKNYPNEMIQKVNELSEMSETKLDLAKNIYLFVNNSYTSPIRQYLREPNKIFQRDVKKVWNNQGEYYPSNTHTQNNMFKEMLVLSGRFEKDNFKFIQSWCTLVAHEYWILDVDEEELFVVSVSASPLEFVQLPLNDQSAASLNAVLVLMVIFASKLSNDAFFNVCEDRLPPDAELVPVTAHVDAFPVIVTFNT